MAPRFIATYEYSLHSNSVTTLLRKSHSSDSPTFVTPDSRNVLRGKYCHLHSIFLFEVYFY